ncbi:MAG: N-acetylmuramoyl-L-alanine amidase [Saprospiraceae bacterium]|nr:N-acetylmuramoyl-L-alanine amidase [Saprospiraceae bacterium]
MFYNVVFTGPSNIDSLEIHFFDPGSTPPQTSKPHTFIPQTSDRAVCTCPQPAFQGRLDWCPDGSCPADPTPEFVPDPTHVIVHHTAGTNVSSDWAAVVRSIWDFHVNTNGWDDIGYNWLVDPNGVLYEGRGDGRLGAHFCAQNGKTTGICVIGDFTSIQPQAAAMNTLADFLAWETCDENIDPLGTSFHSGSGLTLANVSGHRDGCNTSCPGDTFYPLLPNVRQATLDNIENGCDVTALEAPTVLAITFVSHNKINLQWLDNSNTEAGYVIERSDNVDNDFSPIIQLPANATAFSDNGVSPNNTYFYRVRAKQGSAFSDYSNVAVAITSVSSAPSQLHGGSFAISPNPTTGQVFLSIENQWVGRTEAAVFDGLGRMVIPAFYEVKQHEKQLIKLDLGHLSAGLYWVKMVQGTEVGWLKVAKN